MSSKSDAIRKHADQPTFGGARGHRLTVLPGRYFVRVHPGALRPHLPALERAAGRARMSYTAATARAVPEGIVEPLNYLRDNAGLKNVRPLFADTGRGDVGRAKVSGRNRDLLAFASSVVAEDDDSLAGLAIAEIDPRADRRAIAHAQSANAIDFIEPVPARWLAAKPDPMLNTQWGLRVIRWFEAARPDAKSVTVGVLDTGVDQNHPDLKGVVSTYDHRTGEATDLAGHGTHVTGIIAAKTNNGVGIAGTANCRVHMWKVFSDEPIDGEFYVDPDLMSDALRAAADAGLVALNMSLGGSQASQTEELLLAHVLERGALPVAAMGNEFEDGNPTSYPAAYASCLAVGSIAEDREHSAFSNTGKHIGLCAPGSNILSTVPRTRALPFREERMYATWSGTSMAAPHVTAAAAMVAVAKPELSAADIGRHLRKTAATLPAMKGKARTNVYGDGLLDVKKALP
ncbi:MAG: hypothetical protein QOI80_3591 [Solirubrobacteraceae bacterium]|nr:hypothetical protein [Solirubrobacteraceae bacterium]